jgi:hypothetical protein
MKKQDKKIKEQNDKMKKQDKKIKVIKKIYIIKIK